MDFGIGSAFSKSPGSAFSEGPCRDPGPPYRLCLVTDTDKLNECYYKTYY